MAEFNLERFKYSWKNNWTTGTAYKRDDIVRYGGKSYVCIVTHTADANFYTDLDYILPGSTPPKAEPRWTVMTSAKSFVGRWATATFYKIGDIVLHDGALYVATGGHSSTQFSTNASDWSVFADGAGFVEDWITDRDYGRGAIVRYGGINYKCLNAHYSQTTLEDNQSDWEVFYNGIRFAGVWQSSAQFRKNDLVLYGGSIFKCTTTHTSTDVFADDNFAIEFAGYQFSGEYNAETYYQEGDIVRYGGYLYFATGNSIDVPPGEYELVDSTAVWTLMQKSYNFRGEWSQTAYYYTGDLVRRGGNLYKCIVDIDEASFGLAPISLTDYEGADDSTVASDWESVIETQNWRGTWSYPNTYSINDTVIYFGDTYVCTESHVASIANYPGDNGNGFDFWNLLVQAGSPAGLSQPGDMLIYGFRYSDKGDGSTQGAENIPIGGKQQILTVNDDDFAAFREHFNDEQWTVYVSVNGVDDYDPRRGRNILFPFKTIKFACEYLEDNKPVAAPGKVKVDTGLHNVDNPVVVPALTVIMGDELRSTKIEMAPKHPQENAADINFVTQGFTHMGTVIEKLLVGDGITNSPGNSKEPVIDSSLQSDSNIAAVTNTLISQIIAKIEYDAGTGGFQPTITGSPNITTDSMRLDGRTIIYNNREYLEEECARYIQDAFAQYTFYNDHWVRTQIRTVLRALIYDLKYPGNVKSELAGRQVENSFTGGNLDDMFWLRDATGLRNSTLNGCRGSLNPAGVFDIYQRPTGGAYCALDPGYGPDDESTWILTRSPYIQGVTTLGTAGIGKKIDGALHNGGNKSMVSNDFTQVISDGIGAWVLNNARAELVSVFTYYSQVGYLAEDGGIIRATNGNNSYGSYGSIADGRDADEVPQKAAVDNQFGNEAVVDKIFAGEITDRLLAYEYTHAGEDYTSATSSIVGAGIGAEVIHDDIRDGGLFQARIIDPPDSGAAGGSGFTAVVGSAQEGGTTSIKLASADDNDEDTYRGMRIIITSGPGVGQYAYLSTLDEVTKVATIRKESDGSLGWDHIVPGTAIEATLTTGTRYSIEPRISCAERPFNTGNKELPTPRVWQDVAYGYNTVVYQNVSFPNGTGTTVGYEASNARFTITRNGISYSAVKIDGGYGYAVGDTLTVAGNTFGGTAGTHDCTITVDSVSNDSANSIVNFSISGTATTGVWVAISGDNLASTSDPDGDDFINGTMPGQGNYGDWYKIVAGNNRFVAFRSSFTDKAAYSIDGANWFEVTLPHAGKWMDCAYSEDDNRFVAVAENDNTIIYTTSGQAWQTAEIPINTYDDSTNDQWTCVTYGAGRFVAVSSSKRAVAYSEDGITWARYDLALPDDEADDSNSVFDFVSVAYGNNMFVALTSNKNKVFTSMDRGETWTARDMASPDDSTPFNWQKLIFANGLFFAVGDTASRVFGADDTTGPTSYAVTSVDGINWTERNLNATREWTSIAYGKPITEDGYYMITAKNSDLIYKVYAGAPVKARAKIAGGLINSITLWDPGSGYNAANPPSFVITDNDYTADVYFDMRIGNGVLANPSFINRGAGYKTSSTTVTVSGDGYADIVPAANVVTVKGLSSYPNPGAQLLFAGILDLDTEEPNDLKIFSAAIITPLANDEDGKLRARIQISPSLKNGDNLAHETEITIRERYSQCRISGHDFLDIGTGNFEETNYPTVYAGGAFFIAAPENEVVETDGGRVFYTSTDQDGNFRAGELFSVQQATGVVTISAEYFDLDGLSELALGGVRLGGSGAVVNEFSTDPNFSQDSNNVIPTQRAIATFLATRLSEGGSELETSNLIAGVTSLGTVDNIITTTTGTEIRIEKLADFSGEKAGVQGNMISQILLMRAFDNDDE